MTDSPSAVEPKQLRVCTWNSSGEKEYSVPSEEHPTKLKPPCAGVDQAGRWTLSSGPCRGLVLFTLSQTLFDLCADKADGRMLPTSLRPSRVLCVAEWGGTVGLMEICLRVSVQPADPDCPLHGGWGSSATSCVSFVGT